MDATEMASWVGLILSIPTAVLGWYDLQQRREARRQASAGLDVRPTTPAMPEPVRTGQARTGLPHTPTKPAVRPTTNVYNRVTAKLGTPLSIPRRILAGLIDVYGTALAAAFLAGMIADPIWEPETFNALYTTLLVVGFAALAAFNASGRSIGKKIVGAKLVRHSNRNIPVTFWRSLGRLALTLIPFSWFTVLAKDRRTLYDQLTDTVVIRNR